MRKHHGVTRKDFPDEETFLWTRWRFEHPIMGDPDDPMWPVMLEGRSFTFDPQCGVRCGDVIVEPWA